MDLYPEFLEWFRSLNTHDAKYVVIGGYALGFHGLPRMTKDLDILVLASPDNAERVLAALDDFGFGGIGIMKSDLEKPRYFFRLGRTPVQIDLMTKIVGVTWEEIVSDRFVVNYDDVPIWVMGKQSFIQAKLAAGRPQDLADVDRIRLGDVGD